MAIYTIVVKRGSLEYSLSGDDKAFVAAHIHDVFSSLKNKKQTVSNSTTESLRVENKPQEEPQKEEQEINQELTQEPTQDTDATPQPSANTETLDALEFLFPSNKKEEPKEEPQKSELPIENVFVPKHDLNEENIQSESNEDKAFDFDNILEEKMKAPVDSQDTVYEETPPITEDYSTFIKNKAPENMTDYLVITAYYMFENEGITKFAIKQLNQKLFSSMKLLVDNKTAQNALERGLIEVVADFSENGITEYSLTELGRNYYLNDLK